MTESPAVSGSKAEVGGAFTSNIKQRRVQMLVAAVQSATITRFYFSKQTPSPQDAAVLRSILRAGVVKVKYNLLHLIHEGNE